MIKKNQVNYILVPGFLLVEPTETDQPKGYSVITDDQKPQFGKVLKVGASTWYDYTDRIFKPPCKVGDEIIHSSVGFEIVKIEDKEYRLVPFIKVLMIKI